MVFHQGPVPYRGTPGELAEAEERVRQPFAALGCVVDHDEGRLKRLKAFEA